MTKWKCPTDLTATQWQILEPILHDSKNERLIEVKESVKHLSCWPKSSWRKCACMIKILREDVLSPPFHQFMVHDVGSILGRASYHFSLATIRLSTEG